MYGDQLEILLSVLCFNFVFVRVCPHDFDRSGIGNASVTFALRRVYDARTMSKSPFPCGLRRETLRSSYGFTGIVAFTILFNSAQ